MKFWYLSTLFFVLSFLGKAGTPLILRDADLTYSARGNTLDLFHDSTNSLTFELISSPNFKNRFIINSKDVPRILRSSESSYWAKFEVINKSGIENNWLIELYDFEIDHFDIYLPDGKGGYNKKVGGDGYPFSQKEFYHKNFVFELLNLVDGPQTIYIRFQSESPMGMNVVIRHVKTFSGYANTEYYCLAIFYGIALAMIFYNLFLFMTVRSRAYLYYVLYVISIAIYILCHDGTGFQYLWPEHPYINNYIQPVAGYFMLIFALLYSQSFLSTKFNTPQFHKLLNFCMIFRTILFMILLFHFPEARYILYLDILILMAAYAAAIRALKKGFRPARFYLLAFIFFFAGFFITSLEELGLIFSNIFTVYGLNFGLVIEMLLLSLAQGDRIRGLMTDKEKAQTEIIHQLRENKELKDEINKELEQKVNERTQELEYKNRELDTFVYKASHDIKGPLKSIIGLTTVGLKDVSDPAAREYFEHIQKSSIRLDSLLSHLLKLTKVKEAVIEKNEVDFRSIVEEVISSFEHFQDFNRMTFKINIRQSEPFISDKKLIYSIIQNLIENPIKYNNPETDKPHLNISIIADKNSAELIFEDNGIGIPEDKQSLVFEMFYKVNEASSGTGLGLHLVQLAVKKLGGEINLQSEQGKGSTFTVKF